MDEDVRQPITGRSDWNRNRSTRQQQLWEVEQTQHGRLQSSTNLDQDKSNRKYKKKKKILFLFHFILFFRYFFFVLFSFFVLLKTKIQTNLLGGDENMCSDCGDDLAALLMTRQTVNKWAVFFVSNTHQISIFRLYNTHIFLFISIDLNDQRCW